MRSAVVAGLALSAIAFLNVYIFLSDTTRIRQLQHAHAGLQRQQEALQSQQTQILRNQEDLQLNSKRQPQPLLRVAATGDDGGVGATDGNKNTKMEIASTAVRHQVEPVQELSQRVCGSPAIDGYAHVDPACLETSPTAKWWTGWIGDGGTPDELQVHFEYEADFDGLAVGWGINNKKATAQECAEACRNHRPGPHVGGPFQNLPCNAFVWCPTKHAVCFEPDAHKHTAGDCWLKFIEAPAQPEVNFRGKLSDEFRRRHPNAPARVQWVTGVLLPRGTSLGVGTMGPRSKW